MSAPALSVILVASSDFRHICKTIRHLRAQTRAADMELVIAAANPETLASDPAEWQGFHSVQWVRTETATSASLAKVRALRHANAPLIAFTEDHVFPGPNWAEVLITAHRQPYAAVSVEMRNANPSAVSAADMILSFGQWIAPAQGGFKSMLPGHNTCYKREIVESFGDEFRVLLDSEAVLHRHLTQRGETLYLETAAFIEHLNTARWAPFCVHAFLGGRVFGAIRRSENHWGIWKRVLYAAGAPLVPLVRFSRMLPDLKRTGALNSFDPLFWFALVTGLMLHATGEAVGYLAGAGDAVAQYAPIELHRAEQLRADERHLAFE